LCVVLQALRVRHTLPPLLHRANTALGCVAEATRQIMTSAGLVSLLQALLAHGNFVNAGTARGGAAGVKLDGLEKANSLRTQDGKGTLLRYVCAQLPSCQQAHMAICAQAAALCIQACAPRLCAYVPRRCSPSWAT